MPRWIAIPFITIIGLILWLGVLSDSSGYPVVPGAGSILYVSEVICVAALLAYADRKRDAYGRDESKKNRKDGPE